MTHTDDPFQLLNFVHTNCWKSTHSIYMFFCLLSNLKLCHSQNKIQKNMRKR